MSKAHVMRGMIVGALCLLLAGCGVQSVLNSITTSEDRSYAISIIRALRTGDDAAVVRDMPQTLSARIKPELPKMRESLPQSANADVHLVEARAELLTASRRTRLVYAVDDNRRHALVSLSIVRLKDDVFLQGLYVTGLPQPIESLAPSFSLSGKAWGQYLFLGCALLALCTSLTSLHVLYRATNVPRKWPWAVACAFGVGQITMNWETGQVFARMWAVELFGALAEKPGVLAPWYISLGLPIGAYVFLLRQAHARAAKRESRTQA